MFNTANNDSDTATCNPCCRMAHDAGQKVRELIDSATNETCDLTTATVKQIRSNPIAASAVAAGVGFLLGALLHRR